MVDKELTTEQLRSMVSAEKAKLASRAERQRLQTELRQLKTSGRADTAGRIGRGFAILRKKAGAAVIKQARAIRERQIVEEKRRKKTRRKGGALIGQDSMFAPLDF